MHQTSSSWRFNLHHPYQKKCANLGKCVHLFLEGEDYNTVGGNLKIGWNKEQKIFFWNSCKLLSCKKKKIWNRKIQNLYHIWSLPALDFLIHKIKEQEFQILFVIFMHFTIFFDIFAHCGPGRKLGPDTIILELAHHKNARIISPFKPAKMLHLHGKQNVP